YASCLVFVSFRSGVMRARRRELRQNPSFLVVQVMSLSSICFRLSDMAKVSLPSSWISRRFGIFGIIAFISVLINNVY
ncbi:unnamed protein product, partial [Brassica oleracea]